MTAQMAQIATPAQTVPQPSAASGSLADGVFREMAAKMADAVLLVDSAGTVRFANLAATTLFGHAPEEILGRDIGCLTGVDGRAGGACSVDIVEDGGISLHPAFQPSPAGAGRTVPCRRKDGSPVHIHFSTTELTGADGRLFACVMRDVTADRETLRRLDAARLAAEAAGRARAKFFADLGHELRTPLNAIIGFAEMIEGEMVGPVGTGSYVDYAGLIRMAGERLLAVLTDIVDMARIDAGTLRPTCETVDLADLTRSCVQLLQAQADRAELTLDIDQEAPLPPMRLDTRLMRQALLRLLNGLIEAARPGSRISVMLASRDEGVRIEISGAAKDSRRDRPTGLCLPLARALIELHGGRLVLDDAIETGMSAVVTLATTPDQPIPPRPAT